MGLKFQDPKEHNQLSILSDFTTLFTAIGTAISVATAITGRVQSISSSDGLSINQVKVSGDS